MDEEICTNAQTVVEQIALEANVHLLSRLPLDLIVTDIGQLHTHSIVIVLYCHETGTSCIVGNIIITADIKTNIHTQVVNNTTLREPILVSQHPSQLYAREYGPFYAEES